MKVWVMELDLIPVFYEALVGKLGRCSRSLFTIVTLHIVGWQTDAADNNYSE